MTDTSHIPYAALEPDLILNAVESIGLPCSGSLLALNSYENRVYQIGIEDAEPVIAKFYRPGRWTDAAILEEHHFSNELVAHDIPVIPPLVIQDKTLHQFAGFRFAVFPRKGGRPLELDNLEQLEWMGRFIGRVHAVGACRSFQHRSVLSVESYGYVPYQFLIKNNFIPSHLIKDFSQITEAILKKTDDMFKSINSLSFIRLHGDCHAGNVLWSDSGLHIVDLDDCLTGPAIQDLWMLLSGDEDQINAQLECVLRGYKSFHDFDMRELILAEALRALRMIMYSGWLAARWNDPAFHMSFPWFNTGFYWQEQLQHLNEQLRILSTARQYL